MSGVQDLVSSPGKAVQGLGSKVGGKVGDEVKGKVDEAGGPGAILGDTLKNALPFGGGGGDKGGGLGVGKGRRMPVQQSIDIAAPIETVYNQWTQYEDWPKFMHRVVSASQDDDTTVKINVKIWTRTREFTAEIETQRPDDRIKWKVSEGISHAGLVSFHELGPNLTRVLLSLDVQPGGMIEKMARGMRHVKRAARGDLHRFKAFIEMAGEETGAWRGVIEDGEVVEEHDPSYDEQREYSDPDEVLAQAEDDDEPDDDEEGEDAEDSDESDDDDQPRAQRSRRRRSESRNGHGSDEETERPRRAQAASRSSSSRSASGSSARRGSSGSGSRSKSGSSSGGSSSSRKRPSAGSKSGGSSGRTRASASQSGSRSGSRGKSTASRSRSSQSDK
ncbi:MAG TPA: SRPBCC family protein [Solirubrobacteraceae bacterium]|nr:SRPBCC family protein [Solirubrobacteraceae bacterium]